MMKVFSGSNRKVGQTLVSDIMTGSLATSASPVEMFEMDDTIFENIKSANRQKFSKHNSNARFNRKELRKREHRKRVRKSSNAPEHHVKPQAEDPPECPAAERRRKLLRERNDLARAAASAPSQLFGDGSSELSSLLNSIRLPPELMGEDTEATAWLSYLENLVILGYQLGRADSMCDIVVAITAYIKMHSSESIITSVMELIDDVTQEPDDDEVTPQAWTARDVQQKWELFKTNTVFKKVSYLISAAMSLTVCQTKKIEWSPFGLKLVALEAAKEQLKAYDIIDALISTFTWFAETGYRVIQEKSLLPLLYSDQNMRKFNEASDYVLAHAEQVLAGNGENVQDFENKVDDVLRQVSELKSVKDSGPTALWLQQKYSLLVDIKYKIVAKHRNTAIRFAPFGVGITGPSGVGKSTLSKLTMKTSLHAMGFDTDPKRIITKDMFDKYDSTYTSDILGMFMDDVGNGKAEFTQVSPTDVIIKFFNNMAAQAVKAELNAKGVVFIAFKVGILTSNFEDYQVKLFTNKSEAALRRFIHTRTSIKPHYRIPGGISLNTNHPDLIGADLCHDVWDLTIEECFIFETKKGKETFKFRIMNVEMPDGSMVWCENLDLKTYLDVIIVLAKRHKLQQESVVNRSEKFDSMEMCKICCRPVPLCECPSRLCRKLKEEEDEEEETTSTDTKTPTKTSLISKLASKVTRKKDKPEICKCCEEVHCDCDDYDQLNGGHHWCDYCRSVDAQRRQEDLEIEPHGSEVIGKVLVDAVRESVGTYINNQLRPVRILQQVLGFHPVKLMSTALLSQEMLRMLNEEGTPFLISLTPEWLFRTGVFQRSMNTWQKNAAKYDVRHHITCITAGTVLGVLYCLYHRSWWYLYFLFLMSWSATLVLWSHHRARLRYYQTEYSARRDALPTAARAIRDGHVMKGVFAVTTLVIGLKLFQIWNRTRIAEKEAKTAASPNGSITVESMESSPSWFGFMMDKVGVNVDTTESSKRATPSQIISTLEKSNLFWAEFERADGTAVRCNIFFPRKSVAWFPEHIFYNELDMTREPTTMLKVKVFRHNQAGGVFSFKCELSHCVRSKEHDLVCVYVPNCPDLRDKLKWLPISKPSGISLCTLVKRSKDEVTVDRVNVDHKECKHTYKSFYGGSYTTDLAVDGACMAPLVLEQKDPTIVGFHIGGNIKAKYGVMQTITLSQAEQLIADLEKIPGVILSAKAAEIPKTQYGVELISTPEVHPHSMAAKLEAKDYVDVLGSVRLRSMQLSTVHKSMISDAVEEVTGVPNQWGPPDLVPNWKAFNATLEHIVNPADMFGPSRVLRAMDDWKKPLEEALPAYQAKEQARPLTLKESILGIPGKRFLDPLPMKTSMGGPVFGKKSLHFTDVVEGKVLVDRVPSDEILTEMERIKTCWTKGERAYPLTVATLKDEPTPIGKEKVRVFQAGAVAMSLYIRKYFLPIARFLSLHPMLSESAVGVNAFSHQWKDLMDHATKYAPDNQVNAWDYSKYDLRMTSEMTRYVLYLYIGFASKMNYSEEDIQIMKAMVVDITHPLIDYNGTMIMAYNMNTSGNNITVNINSTAGSLYVRMGFFDEYPDEPDFRSCVAAMTYGDDFKGSVKKEYRNFHFFSFRDFLAKHGMKITPPDKKGEGTKFMDDNDADFLKRKSFYIPEIGTVIGQLDEMSIFKSLHSNLRSSEPDTKVSTSCIETAMHEWFAHGREKYEERAAQMREICSRVNLPVPATKITFDQRVEFWLAKNDQSV